MHTELVASMSEPLRALVKGGMDESCRDIAEWLEVDEATFMRFFQFAYTGDFDAEAPEVPPPKSPETPEEPVEGISNHDAYFVLPNTQHIGFGPVPRFGVERRGFSSTPKLGKKKAAIAPEKKDLWTTFEEVYPSLEIRPAEWSLPDQDPTADFTRVFLAYARLYVLADEKDIQGLADHSLKKLHHTLTHFSFQGKGADSIASLAEYCFENTCDKGAEQDGLRRLVCLYSACKLEILWASEAFRRVFAETGDFSIGLVGMLLARLG
ncbi:hypothetical protein PG993_012327 [Apiospora rasikravindrae]|uniref:BTB domain-containing protein n=1 Tax=Apiospora rasikravindrae TaxID=990691 RepID=A0ABR1S3W7_9PEZI